MRRPGAAGLVVDLRRCGSPEPVDLALHLVRPAVRARPDGGPSRTRRGARIRRRRAGPWPARPPGTAPPASDGCPGPSTGVCVQRPGGPRGARADCGGPPGNDPRRPHSARRRRPAPAPSHRRRRASPAMPAGPAASAASPESPGTARDRRGGRGIASSAARRRLRLGRLARGRGSWTASGPPRSRQPTSSGLDRVYTSGAAARDVDARTIAALRRAGPAGGRARPHRGQCARVPPGDAVTVEVVDEIATRSTRRVVAGLLGGLGSIGLVKTSVGYRMSSISTS